MTVVCFAKCWACMAGQHYVPAQWHTWADEEDVAHARTTGAKDPRESRCGCWCAQIDHPAVTT